MLILGIDHAAIKTSRLDESRSFYTEVLGLRDGPRPAFEFGGAWLYAGEHDVVHLVETDQDKAPSRVASINHFALRVADIDAAAKRLRERVVPFQSETTPGGELRQLYVTDPNGVRVELNAPG
ncbi:VOC family protein [Caulobacter sp.]|uniref:VOC family protein n=1 Tax=Caulobacter sp. TaxID=78 RepID=UPI0031D8043A